MKRPRQRSILGDVGEAAQKSPLPRHIPMMSKPLIAKIELGSFYEIDQSKLSPTTALVLRSIRVVMVTAKNEVNVTVRYPSTQSLEAYFIDVESLALGSRLYPTLDEKYIMGPDALGRKIPSQEFGEHRHYKSFWLKDCYGSASPVSVWGTDGAADFKDKKGSLLRNLQNFGLKGWGSRRLVAYLREPSAHHEATGISVSENEQNVKDEQRQIEKNIIQYSRKRKRGRPAANPIKKIKHSPTPEPMEIKPKLSANKKREYVDRWPTMRYEAAAKSLCEILRAKGAVNGNPIARSELRGQARNSIGDTGLLDHLLKHLAEKMIPGANERLRRRFDAEGKMEYWLEDADLVHVRMEAGVQDPYWTPPPGWKPGDRIGPQDCLCSKEVILLKEELSSMRRQIEELKSKNGDKQAITVVHPDGAAYFGRLQNGNVSITKKDMYEALLKKKSSMEEQLLGISKALLGLEEEMKLLPCENEAPGKQDSVALVELKSLPNQDKNKFNSSGLEDFTEVAQELSENDGAQRQAERTRMMKLNPCEHQDILSKFSYQAVDNRIEDPMALTPVSVSPHSTTTSLTSL